MSDRVARTYHDSDGKSGQSMHSSQSVWMAHWTHTCFTVAPFVQDRASLCVEKNSDRDFPSAKGFTEVSEARTVRIMNRGLTSSKSVINERLDSQSFPMFKLCENAGSGFDPKNDPGFSFDVRASRPQIDCNVDTTQLLLSRFSKGKTPVFSSFMGKQELNQLSYGLASKDHLSNTNFTPLGQERDGYHGPSALLVGEKNLDNHSTLTKYGTSVLGQSNTRQLPQNPLAGNYRLPIVFGQCSEKVDNHVADCFPSSSRPPEASNPELHHGRYSLQKRPGSVHDMESMRLCTMNSMEGFGGGGPGGLSQTTHNLSFMNNLSREKPTFRESNVSAKPKRKMFGELLNLSLPLGHNKQRLKLQPLGSFSESDGVNNVGTPEAILKNESSAETDTMDMDSIKERSYLPGVNSSPFNKDILIGQNPPSQPTVASTGDKVGNRWPNIMIPNNNKEVPVLPAAGRSSDNEEPTTSRTESLDAEHLLSHSEHPVKTKSTHCPGAPTRLDPGGRWLKRLKLSTLDPLVLGTKSSNFGELHAHEKVNKLFGKILGGSKNSSSETIPHKDNGDEQRAKDQTAIVSRNVESSSPESAKKGHDILLSHPWIQRWCRDQNHQKKAETVVVCEPQSTKLEFDDLKNKQFPSIAAMALMGKAMSGFQPCKFQRKGSFMVWNAKGF